MEIALDVASRYLFRGHEKDDGGAVLQPAGALTYTFHSSTTSIVRELSAGALAWSSVHAGTRGYPGDLGLYEVDLGLSLAAKLSKGWTADLIYTSYLAPTGAFDQIHEIGVALGFGQVGREGTLAFSPRALLAQEVRDGGGPEDTYLEAGGDLELPAIGAFRWTVPVMVGMSIDGFYRNEAGGNEWFGFLGTGIEATASWGDLGLGGLPVSLAVAVDAAVLNRAARLTHVSSDDVVWTTRLGLSVVP